MTSTNEGKDVKSNQTSGPKGKSYYIELYKFLEARLSEGGDASERTKHLCVAWRSVHSLCQQSAPSTHAHLLNWVQRHTARAVLQTEWQTPKRKDDRKSLEEAIDAFIGEVAESSRDGESLPWEMQLAARGEWFKRVLDNPWGHPVLTLLLNPNGTPPTDDEVLAWLKEERGVTFVVRLHTLVGEKCEDIAVSLAAAVMERARAALPPIADSEEHTEVSPVENKPTFANMLKEEAGFTTDVWDTLTDIEFVLLHKRDSTRCIALAKQTPLLCAYHLIERLQKRLEVSPREKRLWKNAREVAILIAQVVIARCMVVKSCLGAARTALYCCARLLARMLTTRLPAAADALAAQAPTARHLHTLAQAVDKQLSLTNEDMRPYVCELYVRAITAGMNELERSKLNTEKEAEARSMEKTLASWFVQLGVVLSRSDRISCECALTAFSLHPTQKMYERIDAAPPLAPVLTDSNESKEETVKSEFGSWASDSRSQTNLVKTSETLNMKHTQNQANVLSTAIFNEGEALGLSPELCQDIAVLLAGPRVKTLSWDMDRTLLLENCRAYCEVTQEGTRVLTRELKYLNLDLRQYQHLPEEKDDDENDPYYGIERGYEHLAILEPEEIWENDSENERTDTVSSLEDYLVPRRKKKTKQVPHSSEEDSDPLCFMAEAKRTQKKKVRPHSKERSKERKKKQDLIDPLDINTPNETQSLTKPQKEPKEKKERKKKEKVPKVISGKRSSLASLIGVRVGQNKKKPKDIETCNKGIEAAPVTDSDYDSQVKNTLTYLNEHEETIPGAERKKNVNRPSGIMKNDCRLSYTKCGNKYAPSHCLERPNNLSRMQYRPQAANTVRQQLPKDYNRTIINNYRNYPNDIKANLTKLLDFRRQRNEQKKLAQHKNFPHTPLRKQAILRPDISLQSNISPKSVTIPEIPKSYINKEQADKLAELMRVQNTNYKDSVIQYAQKTNSNANITKSSSMDARYRAQPTNTSSMKITDIVNPSYDRLMVEIAERHSKGQEIIRAAHSQPPIHPTVHCQKPPQKSLNVMTPGQIDYQNFLKRYEKNKYIASIATNYAVDMSTSTREVKKPIMPVSRVIPVIPNLPKAEPKPQQCPKQRVQKKPEPSLNTFSRLSYHKNKQNEIKNKIQTKPACTTSTYQKVSSELDEIIKTHQRAQMKTLQPKQDNVDRLMKPANVPEPVNKCNFTATKGHPLLSNLLQSPTPNQTYRNESQHKSNIVQQTMHAPQNTSLSEKDDNDLLNLLRQKNKLNNSSYYQTNINTKPSTSISKALAVPNYNSTCGQAQQLPIKPANQDSKPVTSLLETKIINIISNSLHKTDQHQINNSISVSLKSRSDSPMKEPVNLTQKKVVKNVGSKDKTGRKYVRESRKSEWKAVMCDLLKHKTPTRGPNALDVALDKSSFELAFEKSLKEVSMYSPSQSVTGKNHHEKADRPKPVITSIQNVIITEKGIKLQDETVKPHNDTATSKTNSIRSAIASETRKLPEEVQRAQFTYVGPKNVDPFISGIPNSDYDLLEELMDDDLRKEIGELSSDDESYNTIAQSFLKPTKTSENRVSVQFNKCFKELTNKPTTNAECCSDRHSATEMLQSSVPKLVPQCDHTIAQTARESNPLIIQRKAPNITLNSNCLMASTSQSVSPHISTTSNAVMINNQVPIKSSTYISPAHQQAPIQNVVLLGQDLVCGGYANIQTTVRNMNNIAPNSYLAVNSTPTMALYQTTKYTAPVVIGASITVPVINNSSAAIPVQPSTTINVAQSCYPAINVEQLKSGAGPQISDTDNEISGHQNLTTDDSQQHSKLQEEKECERKVLSEVQDLAAIENNIDVSIKKDTVDDKERIKKKRLAIINREIYHQCGEKAIPLNYAPLPMKIKTALEKYDFTKVTLLSNTSASLKEDKQKLSDSEEEKLLAQIKNDLQDLSEAINEISSPATPDSNDSKENKSCVAASCRRILLRSSNKITLPKAERMVSETPLKKSKAKLKPKVSEVATTKSDKAKTGEKEKCKPKRASKRLRDKKIPIKEKKRLQHESKKPITKAKPLVNKVNITLQKTTETESLESLDIETALQWSKIPKMVINKNKCNKYEGHAEISVDVECLIPEDSIPRKNNLPEQSTKKTVIPADADNENKVIIPQTSIPQKTSFSKQSMQETGLPICIEREETIPEISLPQKISLSVQSDESLKSTKLREETEISADKKNRGLVPEVSIPQKISLSVQSDESLKSTKLKEDTEISADKKNGGLLIEVSIPQKTSLPEKSTQKAAIFAGKTYENAIPETSHQKIGCLEKSTENKISDLRILGPIKEIEEKHVPEHITVQKNIEANVAVNYTTLNSSIKVFSENNEFADDNFECQNINNVSAIVSKLQYDKFEENLTVTDNNELGQHEKDSVEVQPVPVSYTEALITNAPIEGLVKCDTSDNKKFNDQNKHYLPEKDSIDLDMTVTCEEEPIPKLSPNLGCRIKPINAEKKNDIKVLDDVVIINDDIDMSSKKIENEITVAVSHDIEMLEMTESCIYNIDVKPTPETWLVNKTPLAPPETEGSSILHSKMPIHTNSAADFGDDVVIIDDNLDTNTEVPQTEHGNAAASIEKQVKKTNELHKMVESPVTSSVHSEMLPTSATNVNGDVVIIDENNENSLVKHNKCKATSSPNLCNVQGRSETPQYCKNNPQLTYLPSIDPNKSRVRVTLPNGKKVIATVGGQGFVTLRTLFADPSITEKLNEMNCQKRYTMNVEQVATVDKSNPNKILSTQISKIETSAPNISNRIVETIDLLSDDEDNGTSEIVGKNKQEFVTEYGKFTAPPMDKDLFLKHQNKFGQKTLISLKKVDTKATPQNKTVVAKPSLTKKNTQSNNPPIIPNQYVTSLINDIENKSAAEESKTPIVLNQEPIPEVLEIDDSSNDSLHQDKSSETLTEYKTVHESNINELKNELLKELGGDFQTQVSLNSSQEEPRNGDDVAVVNKIQPRKKRNRKKLLKLSAIPPGKSCPFDDLDDVLKLQITKRKCDIKLVRCDDVAKKYELELDDEPIAIREHLAIFNDLNEAIVESHERSSSPVIELFDLLVSLDEKSPAYSKTTVQKVTSLSCEANWHSTKSMLRLQSVNNVAIVRPNVFEKYSNICKDVCLIDQANPLTCEANWLKAKPALYLLGVDDEALKQPHNLKKYFEMRDQSLINKVIPLHCEANWLMTKPTLHLQGVDDEAMERSHIVENDYEMRDDSSINKSILLSCEANWLTTKPSLHLQRVLGEALDRSYIMENYDEMREDSLINKAIPMSCEANWHPTKPRLYLEDVNDEALEGSHIMENYDEMHDNSLIMKATPLSCEANWLATKPTLHLQSVDDEALERSHIMKKEDEIRDDSLINKAIPPFFEANWHKKNPTLNLQGVDDEALERSHIMENYDEIRDDSLINKAIPLSCEPTLLVLDDEPITIKEHLAIFDDLDEKIVETQERSSSPVIELFDLLVSLDEKSPAYSTIEVQKVTSLSCEANWHSTKSMLRLQIVNNVAIVRPNVFENVRNICEDVILIDQANPLSCDANLLTTRPALHMQGVDICEYDKTRDDSFIKKVIPLHCEANWLMTKPTLHIQGADDEVLARSIVSKYDVEMLKGGVIDRPETIPDRRMVLYCYANWFTTKTSLHLKSVHDVAFIRSNVVEYVKVYGDNPSHKKSTPSLLRVNEVLAHNVTPLSCKAGWFTTKATLHLDTALNAPLMLSNVSTDVTNKHRDCYTSDVVNVTGIIPHQTARLPSANSLVSLVLENFQATDVIYRYGMVRKLNNRIPINLLKRKSSSPQTSTSCKERKLDETPEINIDNCYFSLTVAPDTSVSDLQNVPGHILEDTKIVSHLKNSAQDKTLKCSEYATKRLCIHNLNVRVDDEKQVSEVDGCEKIDNLKAVAIENNTNTSSVHENHVLTHLNEESDQNVTNLIQYQSSPSVIDATHLVAFENDTLQFKKLGNYDSRPLSPSIIDAQLAQISSLHNNISESSVGTENIQSKLDDINEFDDRCATSTSPAVEQPANVSLKTKCAIEKSSLEIENYPNENNDSGNCDDIEVKLAAIVGESLTDANNTTRPKNAKMFQISTSEIFRIILGDESFVSTDSKNTDIRNARGEKINCHTFSDLPVAEHLVSSDHMYYTLIDAGSVLKDSKEVSTSKNDYDVVYALPDVTFFTDNEPSLQEEIVDMRSDEIIDDIVYDSTTNANIGETDSTKLCDHTSALVNLEETVSATTDENCFSRMLLKEEDNSDYKKKENICQVATEDSIKKLVISKDNQKIKEYNTVSIQNKLHERIVEYQNPEAGTCYVIPIIEEFSHTDIETIETTKVVTSKIDYHKTRQNKEKTVNVGSSHQNIISLGSKEVNEHNDLSYDNIEAKLAEIVGECFEENENKKTSAPKTRLDKKYETTYSVEVESYSDHENNCEDVMQPRRIDHQDSQETLEAKLISNVSTKERCQSIRRQICHNNQSANVNNLLDSQNNKVKLLNHTYSKDRKSYKRKMDLSDNRTIEVRLAEIFGEPFAENDNKKACTHGISLDEKHKTSYGIETEVIDNDVENVALPLKSTDNHDSQKTFVNSLGPASFPGVKKKTISDCLQIPYDKQSRDVGKVADGENMKVMLPRRTYANTTELMKTRQKSLKRKIDMSDTKTVKRKYRKGKNIDYPKFTVPALSETVYAKEYKCLIDYCSSIKFSFAVPFHIDNIDVHDTLKSWPIQNTELYTTQQSEATNDACLFAETEKSEALLDPLVQTLSEELISEFDESSYTPSNIHETNFNMGFGERSDRVIQKSKDGESTTFSAATLSDVKQLEPLLPSIDKKSLVRANWVNDECNDQRLIAARFLDHLNLRAKVRSFFERTKAELDLDIKHNLKNYNAKNDSDVSSWPFGDLTSTRCFEPSAVEITVNVVQVGQLPVSVAAQNPVTCDPRVTHVSNASPSQCSPENSLGGELQTTIKTEYTELTTADITLPLMQEYVQHHSKSSETQEPTNLYGANDCTSTQLRSVIKIELMDEASQDVEENNINYDENGLQQLPNGNVPNSVHFNFENNNVANSAVTESDSTAAANSSITTETFSDDKPNNVIVEKPDRIAHAMNAAGISATKKRAKSKNSVDTMLQNSHPNVVTASQVNTNHFSKATSMNTIQQALTQILPPPLNQEPTSENSPQTPTNSQVLHMVQGNNTQSVINKPNGTQLLHIVQNKSAVNTNGKPASQQNTFSGLSVVDVDGSVQQSGNQIVNTVNQKNTNNAGQLLKRVNLLTNLANVQGSSEQKMVQFVCKSADGKSIQLPQQRSMVLRVQTLDPSNGSTTPKQNDVQDLGSSRITRSVNRRESKSLQEMKSRSLYEENYAKFVQNDNKYIQIGVPKPSPEKSTSLPKFNQVFGKQVFQDKQNELDSESLPENSDGPENNNPTLEPTNVVTNTSMLIRKTNPTQPPHGQPNLVQQIKQTIGPMNIQTMHGGVIYTRQIPVNIGNGQTINLITVPSTELVDDSAPKQQTDGKFGNQEADPPIIKIIPTNHPATTPNGPTEDNNTPIRSANETNPQPNPQPQPVLTQMRIKLPMLSKAPQMVGGTRVVRPSFFQIQRNVIGGANQQVYQQLVLTAAPPLGQSIRLPAQVQKPKTPSDTQSAPESQMSSSTLEQLREFDMVLEQVKERSTVQPGTSAPSTDNFTELKKSPDTTDAPKPSTSTQESLTQVLYSVGNTQPLNIVNFVNRKSTITSTSTTSFVRSPDSTGTVESSSSSTHNHLPHTVTSDSCASSCASEATPTTAVQSKPKKKKSRPSTSNSNPFNIKNTPKPSSQKPHEDEQTTQRILYILAEYKEQVENSPDKNKPAPRRRNNSTTPNSGSSKRKRSSGGAQDMSPVPGEDSCRTMGSEDSSCGTSMGECNEGSEVQSPEDCPKTVVRRLTFEQETQVTHTRTTTTTTTIPQRNVIVADGQAFAVRGPTGKPATTVLMPANYLLPVSMMKGGQQIAIVTNRGPKLLVGAGEGGTGGTLLFQRLIGPGELKPVLTRTGVRHIRLPTAALHNLQAFNIATSASANVQAPDSTASPAPAPTPPDLVDTSAMSSPWQERETGEGNLERGIPSPDGSDAWNLASSSILDDYGYEEIVRTDNMDRTVLVVHRKDGRHTTRLTHVSAAALRHKYAILEHELRLQKSLSEECEDLGVDSPSASELFPEAELLFAPSPCAFEQTIDQTVDQCDTPQPSYSEGIPQPELDDQIATDQYHDRGERHGDIDINLDDVGEIVTVGEDGVTTIPLDHEEFARSHAEFARSHPNTTFHSEPEDGEVPSYSFAQGAKGRPLTFQTRSAPGTVVMAPQTTVISQAIGSQNPVKFNDMDMINVMPSTHQLQPQPQPQPQPSTTINVPTVLKGTSEGLSKFDRLLHESREQLNMSNTTSAIVHSTGNGTQVIRRVQYERRDSRYQVEEDAMMAGDLKADGRRDALDDSSSSERQPELYWDARSRPPRKRFDFSSDSDKCCKSPYGGTRSDSNGVEAHTRLDSVIKAARSERGRSNGPSVESHPPLRTYPPKRTHHPHPHHHDVDRSVAGKTRAGDRCHDAKDESKRRASNRGVVKRGCQCCNGSTPPKPKKSRSKKSSDYPHL